MKKWTLVTVIPALTEPILFYSNPFCDASFNAENLVFHGFSAFSISAILSGSVNIRFGRLLLLLSSQIRKAETAFGEQFLVYSQKYIRME